MRKRHQSGALFAAPHRGTQACENAIRAALAPPARRSNQMLARAGVHRAAAAPAPAHRWKCAPPPLPPRSGEADTVDRAPSRGAAGAAAPRGRAGAACASGVTNGATDN